jgi:1,5-anhydro-D-fructose reductase (1,5-anhydro-D-mannitol-forming)
MIDAIRAQPDAFVAAVFSRDTERGRAFAGEFGIPRSYTSLDVMLADPEVGAVYVASTNERHHPEVLACAAAGKHVLCDKPLAMTVERGLEMVAACEAAGVTFATNHHLRNAATHRAMRQAVAEGALGKVVTARISHGGLLPHHLQTWRLNDPGAGAGAVLDLAVHDADLTRFLLGDEIVEVAALTANSGMAGGGVEDTAMLAMRTARGALVSFHETFNAPFNRTSVEVHGTAGSLFAVDCMTQAPKGTVELRDQDGARQLPLAHENLYARGVRRFVDATRGRDTVPCTGRDGVRSLAVALAALESARTGHRVTVPEVP